MLVHGAAANSRWWDHLAPSLLDENFGHVVAIDLSGHGDSGWRTVYSREQWAAEVIGLVKGLGISSTPLLVGHSLGGVIAIEAVFREPEAWSGLIVVDSAIGWSFPRLGERKFGVDHRSPRKYADPSDAVSHFRVVPAQPRPAEHLMEHIASQSLRGDAISGWTWKFDPSILTRKREAALAPWEEVADAMKGRFGYIRGEQSVLVNEQQFQTVAQKIGHQNALTIRHAHHHLILDDPEAFLSALAILRVRWAGAARAR
ncbi:alpha/beta fold hydrolase [Arthrobacter sulfonylureivorans]|uniref:Alpha/beta hydrolase n=1 Tax=Arthrobacter sulfonylureivorans TaxID=2486855 RepID=A0ABY3WE56_9MICC|nr:alpha/beta hydrolase [Arthrobacter sulfonylureivorans]UNK47707.1 alpha/beta hydrolase [Arthrobacter sulfonylureivorans]